MVRLSLALSLLALAVSVHAMDKAWLDDVASYEAALARAKTTKQANRVKTPWSKHAKRLRKAAQDRGNTPQAASVLVAIARFTPDHGERVQALVRLRENHMRSKHIGELIPTLVEWGGDQSKRTLRDIIRHSAREDVVRHAHAAQFELTNWVVGSAAPRMLGRDDKERVVDSRALKGHPFWIVAARNPRESRPILSALAKALTKVQKTHPRAPIHVYSTVATPTSPSIVARTLELDDALRRYNATHRSRVFVFDAAGVLLAKDPYPGDMVELIRKHFKARKTGS